MIRVNKECKQINKKSTVARQYYRNNKKDNIAAINKNECKTAFRKNCYKFYQYPINILL